MINTPLIAEASRRQGHKTRTHREHRLRLAGSRPALNVE
jgi:hypothetical protein